MDELCIQIENQQLEQCEWDRLLMFMEHINTNEANIKDLQENSRHYLKEITFTGYGEDIQQSVSIVEHLLLKSLETNVPSLIINYSYQAYQIIYNLFKSHLDH